MCKKDYKKGGGFFKKIYNIQYTTLLDEFVNYFIHLITEMNEHYCCRYTGYGDSFKFAGSFIDTTEVDSWFRRATHIVAMDATLFHNSQVAFHLSSLFLNDIATSSMQFIKKMVK